jgi:hypothetical protein
MPVNRNGQQITFASEWDGDAKNVKDWVRVQVRPGDTLRKIAAREGHVELLGQIKKRNGIRDGRKVLRHRPKRKRDRTTVEVPGVMRLQDFSVLAGDEPPRITGGYADFSVEDRPERVGITVFDGYGPIVMEVPIRFEGLMNDGGEAIEANIAKLERMAGRGNFPGASVGPPPIIHVSTTNAAGYAIPLIPLNYQKHEKNPNAPSWRIIGIDWDSNPLRDDGGRRVRQLAVVTLQQHTKITLATRSAAGRRA